MPAGSARLAGFGHGIAGTHVGRRNGRDQGPDRFCERQSGAVQLPDHERTRHEVAPCPRAFAPTVVIALATSDRPK